MRNINREAVLQNATGEQKERLTELIVLYQNVYRDLLTVEGEFKHERKEIQKQLEALMAQIVELLEEIETGQAGLFAGEGAEEEDDDGR